MRCSSKKIKAQYLKAFKATGNVEPETPLSETVERISTIFGTYGSGQNILDEIGVPKVNVSTESIK